MKIKEIFKNIFSKMKKIKDKKPLNKNALKHGSYAIAITAIVVAVAVAVNVLLAILSTRVNLEIDLSVNKESTLSEENVEFLKGVDRDVNVTVCASKDDYVGGYLDYYVAQAKFSATDASGQYYAQTIKLLEKYQVTNNHIKVKFVDPQTPEFSEVIKEYQKSNLNYGDMIVEATHTVEGEEVKRSSVVTFEDVYRITESEYAAYGDTNKVSGNFLETALTSAIYKVTSTETKNAVVIGTHCNLSTTEYFAAVLGLNNFEVSYITDVVIGEISEDAHLIVIASPKEDFSTSELEVIEKWLLNDGKRGRGLMYFASTTSPKLTNLHSYLEEWGIAFKEGVVYETDESSSMPDNPLTLGFTAVEVERGDDNADSYDFMRAATTDISLILSGSNVPMYQAFDSLDKRTAGTVITSLGETSVVAPAGSSAQWKPDSSYEKSMANGVIITRDLEYIDNVAHSSYVAAFASTEYIDSEWVSYPDIDNLDVALNAAKVVCEAEEGNISFATKTITSESYADKISTASANVVRIIFQYAIPVILVALGVVIFVRRARR